MIRISDNDLRVLEYLSRYRNPRDASQIAAGAPLNVEWVRARLRKLADAGLVRLVEEARGTNPSTWTLADAGRERLEAGS